MHPFMNCLTCDPEQKEACTYLQSGICAKEAALPPAVCPMFEDTTKSKDVSATEVLPH